jgi:nucleotide-binding universal stress UspA family protein
MKLLNRQNGNGKIEERTIRHMLVPFTNTEEDRELLQFACRIAEVFKAKLTVVYVLEVPRSVRVNDPNAPGREEGIRVLRAAQSILQGASLIHYEVDVITAHHAGHALVEKAIRGQVDTILIEAHQRQRLGMTLLGDTVDTVLKKAQCHVWIHRAALVEE